MPFLQNWNNWLLCLTCSFILRATDSQIPTHVMRHAAVFSFLELQLGDSQFGWSCCATLIEFSHLSPSLYVCSLFIYILYFSYYLCMILKLVFLYQALGQCFSDLQTLRLGKYNPWWLGSSRAEVRTSWSCEVWETRL